MAVNRKYADLPDLDSAPDIYETPELTDDTSTVPTTAGRTQSDDEYDDDEEEALGISRSRLRVDQARSRFLPTQVDAQNVDFSDRLQRERRSYRTSSRRQRILEDGTTVIDDASDDEVEESLETKIARLQREIIEAKGEYDQRKAEGKDITPEAGSQLSTMNETLGSMSVQPEGRTMTRIQAPAGPLPQDTESSEAFSGATYTVSFAPTYEQSHALAKAADFDHRLALLEKAIGITSSSMSELEADGLPRAIMPTLDTLQKQIMALSEASTTSLDGISRRVRTLTQEADQLEKSRKAAKAAQENLASSGGPPTEADDAEQVTKINALYGTLPTIESLTPLLPSLLDRLRSLRAIHVDAAVAHETLERIETQQTEMASDIKEWREGLHKIQATISDGEASIVGNKKMIEGLVNDLEAKMAKLS
ncbi:Dynamitin-domain-containing protein [Xylariaceae sp. FL0016]|nr:Dynamitin-domain-containing protein [Xylariaceae sp. FL0016]